MRKLNNLKNHMAKNSKKEYFCVFLSVLNFTYKCFQISVLYKIKNGLSMLKKSLGINKRFRTSRTTITYDFKWFSSLTLTRNNVYTLNHEHYVMSCSLVL